MAAELLRASVGFAPQLLRAEECHVKPDALSACFLGVMVRNHFKVRMLLWSGQGMEPVLGVPGGTTRPCTVQRDQTPEPSHAHRRPACRQQQGCRVQRQTQQEEAPPTLSGNMTFPHDGNSGSRVTLRQPGRFAL